MCACFVPVRYVRYVTCVCYVCSALCVMCSCVLLALCVLMYVLSVLGILCCCMRVECVFSACACHVSNVRYVSIVPIACYV